ncbi:MAG: wax ester/triacylglycerol synthase family O-acyltransferase [Solirubrobacterales bacterium]|nr:wax ester/triacylglycerol synthase family O-acyltransferase [Solirubrobacterales bacterium]MCB8969517.1 wax ester/triacylglycerol synthase family O-acyltransferase [Thermoleophilales bacterium]
MAQGHMDRLSAIDASFLANESGTSHMHVGAITIFEGPPPAYDDLLAHIESRLHLVPRYRQKLAFPPVETGRPFWVDDPQFNLGYHVRHSALPAPGGEDELRRMGARVFSQQLDRTKPLWELWLVEGLRKKRFALISKTHHALVDGISGVDIATVLFDVKPVPEATGHVRDWIPRPEPSTASLAARGIESAAKAPLGVVRRAAHVASSPNATLRSVQQAAEGLGEVAWEFANPAPDMPLNVPIGPHRRFVWVRGDLAELKRIKGELGGTVNDVVLTAVAGAMRRWLRARGVRTEGLELRALVPVSIRAEDQHGELGNQIAAVRGPLPVYVEDPVSRLRTVREAMDDVKSSKKALGAEMITRFNDFAPPTLLAQASRINFSTRLFNLIVTNVPGPQFPLYVLGRELLDIFPVAFLPENHALAIAIMSYNGKIDFGLLGDYDAMEDVTLVAEGIEAEIKQLLEAAKASEKSAKGSGARRASGKRATAKPS